MLAGAGLRLLLLLSLLQGADGWDGLLEEVRLLQARLAAFVWGRLQLRAQASRAPSAAKAMVMGSFNTPYGGVAFDGEGNLVVADGDNHRIQVFRYSDGAHLRSFGSAGAGAGQFNAAVGHSV